jgi:hypothetical protein
MRTCLFRVITTDGETVDVLIVGYIPDYDNIELLVERQLRSHQKIEKISPLRFVDESPSSWRVLVREVY